MVLGGEVAFHTGDDRLMASQGGIAFLPHGIPHTFQVHAPTARFVSVTGSRVAAPRFDRMVTALGVATTHPTLPEPGVIDPTRVADVCLKHGIQILGPPPTPLD